MGGFGREKTFAVRGAKNMDQKIQKNCPHLAATRQCLPSSLSHPPQPTNNLTITNTRKICAKSPILKESAMLHRNGIIVFSVRNGAPLPIFLFLDEFSDGVNFLNCIHNCRFERFNISTFNDNCRLSFRGRYCKSILATAK